MIEVKVRGEVYRMAKPDNVPAFVLSRLQSDETLVYVEVNGTIVGRYTSVQELFDACSLRPVGSLPDGALFTWGGGRYKRSELEYEESVFVVDVETCDIVEMDRNTMVTEVK